MRAFIFLSYSSNKRPFYRPLMRAVKGRFSGPGNKQRFIARQNKKIWQI